MPLLPSTSKGGSGPSGRHPLDTELRSESEERQAVKTRTRNRRKRYLDTHPEYYSSALELADPLLYDRLVRRFQTPAEREQEGREKGYSGILEADLLRSEAKMEALANPDPNAPLAYRRGPGGEILAEDPDEIPTSKEEGMQIWRKTMELRFLRGDDEDFDYKSVDESEEWDDREQEERDEEDKYFGSETPRWAANDGTSADGDDEGKPLEGETGIQDF